MGTKFRTSFGVPAILSSTLLLAMLTVGPAQGQRLFVGLEDASLATRSSDLSGFPNVLWVNHYVFEVNGATATPDGMIYLCNGAFTTRLYTATLTSPPQFVTTTQVDLHGLGYGGGKLHGFSNFSSPMGIYEINPATGAATLAVSTADPGYRFFGLDYNLADGLLYGYTEYGVSGLYSIDVETGSMTRIVGVPPGVNGQGRALAVGGNTVYLLATRGDEGEPCFAYDLDQGPNGSWVGFTNPYPTHHSTGGAAWLPAPADVPVSSGTGFGPEPGLWICGPNPTSRGASLSYRLAETGACSLVLIDAAGRNVVTLAEGSMGSGRHVVAWDGTDRMGRGVPGGMYFARLVTENGQRTAKILVVH